MGKPKLAGNQRVGRKWGRGRAELMQGERERAREIEDENVFEFLLQREKREETGGMWGD